MDQRSIHRPTARAFSEAERNKLSGFWSREMLDRVRLKEVEKIEIPQDLSQILSPGFIGITFVDTILLRISLDNIHFHELVHVAQFRVLGIQGFASAFAAGVASGVPYHENPLEKQALELEARFMKSPNQSFDAYQEVLSGLTKRKSR
jgi:hypothetical protein